MNLLTSSLIKQSALSITIKLLRHCFIAERKHIEARIFVPACRGIAPAICQASIEGKRIAGLCGCYDEFN